MLNTVPLYSALYKPFLFMGGEREPMVMAALLSFVVVYINPFNPFNLSVGVLLWIFMSYVLRTMAKNDPLMSKIYRRQVQYQKFYSALPSVVSMPK